MATPESRAYQAAYYQANKEKMDAQGRAWKSANREQYNESVRRWQKRNPDKARNSALKTKFGITLDDYNRMLDDQNGVCAICQQNCSLNERLSVDHCHDTGEVRGLLCNSCNNGIGKFKDSQKLLISAANYLGEK